MNFATLLLCAAVVEGSLALGMVISEYGHLRPGWRAWAASSAMRATSNLIYLLPLVALPFLLRPLQFTASLLVFCSAAVSMRGISHFVGSRAPGWLDFAPLLACLAGYSAAFFVFGDPRWRIATLSIGLAYGFGWACWRTWYSGSDLQYERRFVAFALALWAALLLSRAGSAWASRSPPATDVIALQAMHPWYLLGYLVAAVATAVGLLGLRNRQLLKELDDARRDAVRRADYDTLTGLLSRTAVLDRANAMFADSLAQNRPLWVLMIDLDYFKRINDRFGHLVGDTALRAIGEVIRQTIPEPCLAGRFGGEEFLVLVMGRDGESPRPIAERLRLAVHAISVDSGRRAGGLTISIGYAVRDEADRRLLDIVRRADEALLEAKASGRDRVVHGPAGGSVVTLDQSRELAYRHSDFMAP